MKIYNTIFAVFQLTNHMSAKAAHKFMAKLDYIFLRLCSHRILPCSAKLKKSQIYFLEMLQKCNVKDLWESDVNYFHIYFYFRNFVYNDNIL